MLRLTKKILMKKKGKEPTAISLLCGGLGFFCLFGFWLFFFFFTVSTNILGSSKIKMIILVLTSTNSVLIISL